MVHDQFGLDEEQEYHEDIMAWLTDGCIIPRVNTAAEDGADDQVRLLTTDGRDVTAEFLEHFRDEFDGFTIDKDKPGEVSIYTTDYNVYRGDIVVHYDGATWVYQNGDISA